MSLIIKICKTINTQWNILNSIIHCVIILTTKQSIKCLPWLTNILLKSKHESWVRYTNWTIWLVSAYGQKLLKHLFFTPRIHSLLELLVFGSNVSSNLTFSRRSAMKSDYLHCFILTMLATKVSMVKTVMFWS